MRPRKTNTVKLEPDAPKASVTDLSAYRQSDKSGPNTPTPQAIANLSARHDLIADHITARMDTHAPTVVAAAIVLLRADGTVDTSAIGVEAEYVPFLTRGMSSLSARIDRSNRSRREDLGQNGVALLPIVSTLAFMAATYINEYAWLDAALSLAAQFCAVHLWKRSA